MVLSVEQRSGHPLVGITACAGSLQAPRNASYRREFLGGSCSIDTIAQRDGVRQAKHLGETPSPRTKRPRATSTVDNEITIRATFFNDCIRAGLLPLPEKGKVTTLEMYGLDVVCKFFSESQKVTANHDRIAVGVRITGRVQGVCFRAWTEEEARRLGVSGWVRNEADGSVRALFVGQPTAVKELLGRCRQGPPAARVSDVESAPVTPVPEISGFRVGG